MEKNKEQLLENSKHKISLSGSIANLILFAITNSLKRNRGLRIVVGILGFFFLVISVFLYIVPEHYIEKFASPMIITGGILFISFILSANSFDLVLENDFTSEASKEREQAEADYEQDTKDPFAFLELDTTRLKEYYLINLTQAKSSFKWAIFTMFVGFLTIVLGIWLFYFGKIEDKNVFLTSLTTVSGIIINVVSSLYIYLHNKSQKRSLHYFNQLIRNQQLGLSIRLAESLNDENEKITAKKTIINKVLLIIEIQTKQDIEKVNKETQSEDIKINP